MKSGLYKKYISKEIDPQLIVDSVKKATTNMDKNVSQETKDQLRKKARQQPKKLYSDLPKKDRQAAKDYNIKKLCNYENIDKLFFQRK